MNNNSMISMMFEEIKSLITSVDKKIDERISAQGISLPNTPLLNPYEEREPLLMERSIRQIPINLAGIQKSLNQISETNKESEKHVLSHLDELKRRIDNSKTDTNIRHYHVVDLKSSKVMVTFIVLFFVLLGSLAGNIYQIQKINQLNDNDLKYRYIKTTNGITPKDLYKLENIFHYNRDNKIINEIRKEVEDYERRIRETAKKIERDLLKEAKVNKLK